MPEIEISEEIYTRVAEFKHVIEAVTEEETYFDTCVEVILCQGIDSMLAELLGPLEPATLLSSFQQLGSQHPEQVYGYIAETIKRGAETRPRDKWKRRFGFRIPSDDDDNNDK